MFFASDNTSGVPTEILTALSRANDGYARGYGGDEVMDRVRARLREVFEAPDAAVYLVATGTATNALALATLTAPWSAVFCHRHAHIAEDECGAPEFYAGGLKLVLVDGPHGKITPDALAEALATTGASGVHGVQRGALSLTNVTEAGTVYTPAEIAALTALRKGRGRRGLMPSPSVGPNTDCWGLRRSSSSILPKPGNSSCGASGAGISFPSTATCPPRWRPICRMTSGCGWRARPMPWARGWRRGCWPSPAWR